MQYSGRAMLMLAVRTSLSLACHVFVVMMLVSAGVSFTAVLIAIPMILVGGFAVTGFLHRSIAHRTYTITKGWLRKTLLFSSLFSLIGTPLGWAIVHRMHHRNLDGPGDPHSPWQIGFFRSYCHLWQLDEKTVDLSGCRDIITNRELLFFHKHWLKITFAIWLTFYMIWGMIGLYAIGLAGVFAFHAFGVANAVCHYGRASGDIVDLPKMSWLNFGENFHSYHHSFPSAYRFTATRSDPSATIIEWLMKNNLAVGRK